jgi:hypothetical protein
MTYLVVKPKAANLVTVEIWQWMDKSEDMMVGSFELQTCDKNLNIRVLKGNMAITPEYYNKEFQPFRARNINLTHNQDGGT